MAASYPSAVKTFTTRAQGQTLTAAIMNDLGDEITAIQTGLLTGTAPLLSSNSSLATLHVTGNLTLTSTVTIGTNTYIFSTVTPTTGQMLGVQAISGSTVTLGFLTVSGASGGSSGVVIATVGGVGATQIPVTAITCLNFLTESTDPQGWHSTSVSSSLFTCPAGGSGYYIVTWVPTWGAAPSTGTRAYIYKNGANVAQMTKSDDDHDGTMQPITTVLFLDAADTLLFQVSCAASTNSISSGSQVNIARIF